MVSRRVTTTASPYIYGVFKQQVQKVFLMSLAMAGDFLCLYVYIIQVSNDLQNHLLQKFFDVLR